MNKQISGLIDRPMTGKEYLESLNDGREVWIYGKRVENITEHPAFRNSARMIARVYDAMHDPKTRTSSPRRPKTAGGPAISLRRKRSRIRSPRARRRGRDPARDLWLDGPVAGLQGLVPGDAGRELGLLSGYEQNALRAGIAGAGTHRLYQPCDHEPAGGPQQTHRGHLGRLCPRYQGNRRRHLCVGAKVVATASALTNYTFVAHAGQVPIRTKYAPVFIVPTGAPGVKMISRMSWRPPGSAGQPLRLSAVVADG